MADNDQLGAFLASGAPEGAQPPQDAPQADPTPERTSDAPAESKTPTKPTEAAKDGGAKAPEAKGDETPEPDEEIEPLSGADNRTVPFSALEKVRNDWKSKAAASQAEARLLRQQLEEVKRAQQAPPPPPPQAPPQMFVAPPDFTQDPHGWAQAMVQNQQRALLNERLNFSEAQISDKIGAEELGKYVGEFKEAANRDPTLWGKLYSQPNPYAWMTKHMDLLRQQAEIGDDPAAYRARILAEERAKWEQELQAQPAQGNGAPRVSPAANLPPSLAGVRSVAGRTQTTFSGPVPLEDLFPGHNRRAQQQRH
jgi:hypothetical protein